MVKMNDDKAAMFLVGIVGVVAAVGIIVLFIGAGISYDMTGQAISANEVEKLKKKLELSDELKEELTTVNSGSTGCKVPAGYVCCGTCSREGGVCSAIKQGTSC
ncbi:hypothetical protein HZC31_07705 [Candidatus Woesearchaeota archaeon]|nr:hypothetical protein [Candidatus Woesearchaeota archaeon]